MKLLLILAMVSWRAAALSGPAHPNGPLGAAALHQDPVLDELRQFLAIPNVASDRENIQRNADFIVEMFAKRGIKARQLRLEGVPPLVVAEVNAKNAKQTIAFYAHYDGQPVDPAQWTSPPWQPVIREDRIYARSASDDKAPIVAMLAALDRIKNAPSVNLKFVFEGEEEAGSPHLDQYLDKYAADLAADAWILCDGPVHQSRRMQLYFGARGVLGLELTTYGPTRALHSGHYGNWAPNPIVAMTSIVGSMRDTEGRIRIRGFYDDVTPLSEAEKAAIQASPDQDAALRRELGLGRTEGGGSRLESQILLPALNLRGISGGAVGDKASNAIPTEARASIDFRLVPAQTPEKVKERVETHLKSLGYHVVRERPDATTRMNHPKIVRVVWGSGYPPARTAMDLPLSRRVASLLGDPILLPSLGGSIPMYLFQRNGTPVIGVPIVNHDNNQHAANENLRLQNLWDGIEVFVKLFTGL